LNISIEIMLNQLIVTLKIINLKIKNFKIAIKNNNKIMFLKYNNSKKHKINLIRLN